MTRRDPISEALDRLDCETWCNPAEGVHLDTCPVTRHTVDEPDRAELLAPYTAAEPSTYTSPDQRDVDALRYLLDAMENFTSNDQRARYLLSSNWIRERGAVASARAALALRIARRRHPENGPGRP